MLKNDGLPRQYLETGIHPRESGKCAIALLTVQPSHCKEPVFGIEKSQYCTVGHVLLVSKTRDPSVVQIVGQIRGNIMPPNYALNNFIV